MPYTMDAVHQGKAIVASPNSRIRNSQNVSFHYLQFEWAVVLRRFPLPSTWNNLIFSDFILSMVAKSATPILCLGAVMLSRLVNCKHTHTHKAHNRKHMSKTCNEFLKQFIFWNAVKQIHNMNHNRCQIKRKRKKFHGKW